MKEKILEFLELNKDDACASFSSRLIKDNLKLVGVKLPILFSFAKSNIDKIDQILEVDDADIFEIRMIKLFAISQIKEIEEYKKYFEVSISLITNWSLCDSYVMHSKVIKKDLPYFFDRACKLINNNEEFHQRIGLIIMLGYFVNDEYIDKIFDEIDKIKSNGYYSQMALAWLISVLYVKYTDKTKIYLLNNKVDKSIIKMSIRKINDSYRVSDKDKEWLKKIEY